MNCPHCQKAHMFSIRADFVGHLPSWLCPSCGYGGYDDDASKLFIKQLPSMWDHPLFCQK